MSELDKQLKILEDIRKFLILDLLVKNIQTTDIASILGVNKSTISRLVPVKKIKK